MKIKAKELREKSNEELMQMKKRLEEHLIFCKVPKNIGNKGFDIPQTKKNIARILTIINERKNG